MAWRWRCKGVASTMSGVDFFHIVPPATGVCFQPSTSTSLIARALVGGQVPLQLALLTFY